MGLVALLVWAALLLLVAACWKRLLGLAVSRFAQGRAFRLSVGQFLFGGVADVCLVLHVGPVRQLRISRLSLGLATMPAAAATGVSNNNGDGGSGDSSTSSSGGELGAAAGVALGGGGLWQALLAGQLLMPVQLRGVHITLAPPSPRLLTPQQAGSRFQSAATSGGATARRSKAQLPLWLLEHLPMQLDGLTVMDEVRGVVLHLRHTSLSLHTAQRLVVQGLSAALCHGPDSANGASSEGGEGGSPRSGFVAALEDCFGLDSPPASSRGAAEQTLFFQLERLQLEHCHDGSFSLQQLAAAPAATAGTAAGVAGAPAPARAAMQALSMQLGAVSLTASRQLMQWMERQVSVEAAWRRRSVNQQPVPPQPPQPASCDEREAQQAEPWASRGRQQRLLRLLPLLPREAQVDVQSFSLATASSSDEGLPVLADFTLKGIRCRLARAAGPVAAGLGSTTSAPLASISAGWQQLSASLGAGSVSATTPDEGRQQHASLPPAIALRSGAAEWSLNLSSEGQDQVAVAGSVMIGALGTDVCHPCVQPLVRQLLLASAAVKAALKPVAAAAAAAADASAGAAAAAAGEADGEAVTVAVESAGVEAVVAAAAAAAAAGSSPASAATVGSQAAAQQPHRPPDSAARAPSLARWRCSLGLGDGSRLLFSDAAGRCCWSNSLASCRLTVEGGKGGTAALAAVSGMFEAVGIEMHALTAAAGSLAGTAASLVSAAPPPQMLAARLLRVQVEAPPPLLQQQQAQAQAYKQQAPKQQAGAQELGLSVDATTAGVHLLMQQQQLTQVASVLASLLPLSSAASSATSPEVGSPLSRAAQPDGDPLAAAVVAAAAAAAAGGGKRSKRRLPPPRLTFSCTDSFLLLPTTVTVPAEQAAGGQLLLLPTAPALVLSSFAGKHGGGSGGSSVTVEGCCLLYCEGLASQRFPSSAEALKDQAKVQVLSVDRATFTQGPPSLSPESTLKGAQPGGGSGTSSSSSSDGKSGGSSGGGEGAAQLDIGCLSACADADALLCIVAVADHAAHQLAPVLAAATSDSGGTRGVARAPKQPTAKRRLGGLLCLTVGRVVAEQPLYTAGRDMAVEVTSLRVVVGDEAGCLHSLSTAATVLCMAGSPVLRWRQLEAALKLPRPAPGGGSGGTRLAALPLPPVPPPAGQAGAASAAARAVDDGLFPLDGQPPELAASGQPPGSGSSSYEAYHRARLEAWLEADAATAPSGGAAQASGSGGGMGAAAAALGSGPASTLDVVISGAELIVPHDGEPGPTQRYLELYLKALQTAMAAHLQRIRLLTRRKSTLGPDSMPAAAVAGEREAKKTSSPLFPLQVNMVAERPALRFEHHPLEAWMSSRGPLLQQMAVQQHLWGEVAATVLPADTASPLHAGMVESAFETVAAASQQAWEGLLQDLLAMYRSKLQQADRERARQQWPQPQGEQEGEAAAAADSSGTRSSYTDGSAAPGTGDGSGCVRAPPGTDLMRIGVSRLQGLVVLCCGSEAARAAARQLIAATDPSAQRVPMCKLLKLHADLALDCFEMRLAGTSRPFVAASHVLISGTAAVARQATAPPQTRERQLAVGAHRTVAIPVTVKGCRPPFKFYTDLSLEAEALTVCHSQGLDPTMALVGLAGKRLSPSDPDKSVPRPPPIPWWDDLRYMWRGPLELSVSGFGLTLGGTANPRINETSERMEVAVDGLGGRLLSGCYELELQGLDVTLHRSAGVQQLGGTLLALPFVRAPRANVRLDVDWKLPGGRPAAQHHLFPMKLPPEGDLQSPVYAGTVYKAEAWDLALHVELGQTGDTDAGLPAAAAAVFLGGHQIQWMKQFVMMMGRMPPQLRAVARRGSFFWRKAPSGVPKKGIGKLTQKLCLDIVAAPLEVVHFAADPSDASHGIHLHAPSCTYTACYLLNQEPLSFLKLPPHAVSTRPRRPPATRTVTLSMDVQAGSVTVHKAGSQRRLPGGAAGSMSGGGSPLTSGASTPLAWGPLAGPGAAEVQGEMLGLLDDLVTPFTREQQPIVAAGTVAVTQDGLAVAPGEGEGLAEALAPKGGRPLRVLISDCRVMVDRESRDAVWAAVAHLISAFTTNVTQQRQNLANAAVHPTFSLPASPSPTLAAAMTSPSMPWSASSPLAQLQRQVSESHAARSAEQPAPSDELVVPSPAPPSAHGSVRSSMDGGSLPASAAQQQQQQQLQSGPQQAQAQVQARGEPAVVPSGDSSNELLALLLQQRQESHDAGGQEEPGSPLKRQQQQQEGQAGPRGGGPQHSGAEHQEEEEDEEALMSSPADDLSGQQKYVVEVKDLQICSEAEAAQGRLLLAARSGRLRGLHLPDAGLNVTALLMDEVSAYVSQMDVDPDAPVLWLQPTPEGYQVPAGQGLLAPVRRIFEPILISLRHSKLTAGGGGGAATRRRTATLSSRSGARGTPGGPGSAPSGVRGEELVLRVPEVLAVMDSREFEVLVDVISMLQNPGPTVETVGAEAALLAELEGDEVEEARQLYALLRQQLAELRLSSLALRTSLGLHAFTSQLAPSFIPPAHLLPPLAVTHFFVGEEADFVALQFGTAAELAVAMREHLAAASAAAAGAAEEAAAGGGDGAGGEGASSVPPLGSEGASLAGEEGEQQQDQQQQQQELSAADGSKRSTEQQQAQRLAQLVAAPTSAAQTAASVARRRLGERQQEQQQALLLRWVEEQEGGAFEAVEKTKICLLALKIVARKRQQKHSASRLRLQLDRVVWQLCTMAREPFVQASLHRLSLDKFQNKDHSGSAKFVIGRIDVLDSQGALGPGPGIGAGVILSTWNPDASWERDDMLRVVASMGVPTQTHIIYEHLDLILHPTAFHLTEGIAVAFWEYFFPKEDGSKARAAAAFARSVAVPAAAAARHRRSATALPSDMATSQQGSPLPGSPMRRTLAAAAAAGDGSSQPSSGGQSPRAAGGTPRGSSIVNAGWHSAPGKMHRRASSLLAGEGSLSRQSTLGSATAAAAAAAAAADASLLDVAADTAAALAGGGGGGGGGHVSFHLRRTSTTGVGLLQQRNSGLAFEHGGSGYLPPGVPGSTVAGGRLCRPLSSLSITASEDTVAVRAAAAAPPHRKVRFVHVKLNRAHCRASYEGYPLTFSDLKLVIDNRTYVNIEGRWRDLFNKMKWDIVKSVVKSVAGFQGRKFKELLPEGFPGEDGDGGGRRKPGLFAQLQALGKGGRGKDAAAAAAGAEEAAPSGEDLRAQYKRRMLFGHMALPSPTPGPSAGASAAAEAAAGAAVSGATAGDSPVRGAAAAAQPVQPLAAQDGSSDGSPSAAAQAAQPVTPGTLALQSAATSGGVYSQGDTGPAPDDAARSGEVFAVPSGPLAAGISSPAAPRFSPGPLASGTHGAGAAPLASTAAFGSIGSIAVAEPEGAVAADGEDGSGGGGGGTDSAAAAAALFGQAPDQRGSHHLQTPRWAAKLASKAQKGLHKLRDSLQD